MANNPFFSDEVVVATMNAGSAKFNAGFVAIYTGAQPSDANQPVTGTLLVKLSLSATAFASAVASGVTGARVATATANPIASAAAVATGTAGYFVLYKSDGVTVAAMGSVGTSGCDMNLNTTSIVLGNQVTLSSGTLTQPE